MRLRDLLEALDDAGVTLTLSGASIRASGPRSAVDTFATAITEHRDLIVAHVHGRTTGHVLAFCETCGEPTMTAAKTTTGKARDTWPTCRVTPGCGGRNQHGTATARHVPRPADLEAVRNAPAPPPGCQPPKSVAKARLLGPRPDWPNSTGRPQ